MQNCLHVGLLKQSYIKNFILYKKRLKICDCIYETVIKKVHWWNYNINSIYLDKHSSVIILDNAVSKLNASHFIKRSLQQGFTNFFFNSSFNEIKKAIAPSNKTSQKLPFKTAKTFLLFIYNSRITSLSFQSFKIAQNFKFAFPNLAPCP